MCHNLCDLPVYNRVGHHINNVQKSVCLVRVKAMFFFNCTPVGWCLIFAIGLDNFCFPNVLTVSWLCDFFFVSSQLVNLIVFL